MIALRKKWLKNELLKKRSARKFNRPGPHAQAIRVSDYLTSDRIRFFENRPDHEFVFEELIKMIPFEDSASISAAIHAREEIGSTVITPGIAFPHARIPGLNQIAATLGICPDGVRTGPGKALIRLIFLFISPTENTRNHLRFLTSASSLFLTENLFDDLIALKTREAILEKIRGMESKNNKKAIEAVLINA